MNNFIKNKAVSVGSCEGYFIPSLLTSTAFLLTSKGAHVQMLTHNQPLNIFTIFVGYPGTGKYILSSLIILSIYSIHSQLSSRFLFTVRFLIPLFSFDLFRKIFHNSACCPKPIRTPGVHFFYYQQNNVFRIGETAGKSA